MLHEKKRLDMQRKSLSDSSLNSFYFIHSNLNVDKITVTTTLQNIRMGKWLSVMVTSTSQKITIEQGDVKSQ